MSPSEIGSPVRPVPSSRNRASCSTALQNGIDTNPIENAIRPFCLGRRSWLSADNVAGAPASARLCSLVQCAKANRLEPYAFLRHVFTELPNARALGDIEALPPTRFDPADLT